MFCTILCFINHFIEKSDAKIMQITEGHSRLIFAAKYMVSEKIKHLLKVESVIKEIQNYFT